MQKRHLLILLALATMIFFSFLMTHYLSNKVQFISNDNLPASNPDNRKSLILSNDIGFPSPVIQLQQTIVHGLIESESIALPLLRGDLESFSQENIKENYSEPDEIKKTKSRLNQLEYINNYQNHQK
ncbi:TPA: hypothetical protein RUZ30_001808 [Vibrio cholerae]|nr:hypothetical protein VCSRO140_1948 [Vibrio cholerae]HDZ9289206.1 hypothetical protein [Vibrio cholerae]